MEEKILDMFCRVLNIDRGAAALETARADTAEWDSLAHVMLVAEFEECFQKPIPFEEIENIRKVSDFLKFA